MSKPKPLSKKHNVHIETVLVTGGNGYLATHLIEQLLLTTDYKIKASVRSLSDPAKTDHLLILPHAVNRLHLFEADIREEGSFTEEMKGCHVLFHVASPYYLTPNDPVKDFVEPIEIGTKNVLNSAVDARSVHTVVLTSSMRAVAERPMRKVLDESDWNLESTLKRNPYFYSKTRGEICAWEFYEAHIKLTGKFPFRMVAINPAMVVGPAHTKNLSQSPRIILELMNGGIPAIAGLSFWLVDVRDVIKCHILAAQNPEASGRFICCSKTLTMQQIVSTLKKRFPNYKYPLPINLPNVAAKLVSLVEPSGRASFIRSNLGRGLYKFDNSKARQVLGLEFRNVEESLWNQAADFVRWGHLPDKPTNTWEYTSQPPIKDADLAEIKGWKFSDYVSEDNDQDRGWGFTHYADNSDGLVRDPEKSGMRY